MAAQIRPAIPNDIPTIFGFVNDLAEYEREPDAVVATEQTLHASLFGNKAVAHGIIAEIDGTPVGFAIYFFSFSTWLGRRGLHLEDLYVRPESRGTGVGKQLLTHLARVAVEQGCGRFEWNVLDWNTPAINFYESLGAVPLSAWTKYRLVGDALVKLASTPPSSE